MAESCSDELAGRGNWMTAPVSRWSFRNVREFLPTAPVANNPNDVAVLGEALGSFEEFEVPADAGPIGLTEFLAATAADALLVLRDGAIALEWYAPGMTASTAHIAMSMTKGVTGIVARSLQELGTVDLGRTVAAYVAELADSPFGPATLQQLLDMRWAAVADDDAYRSAVNWGRYAPGDERLGLLAYAQSARALEDAPGDGNFAYVSPNTDVLGLVLERAAGTLYPDLVAELVWRPAGAEHRAYVTLDRQGASRASGGLCATARDLARLGNLVLTDGERDGRRVWPGPLVRDLHEGGDRDAWREGAWGELFRFTGLDLSYRNGWYTTRGNSDCLFAMGIFGQLLFIDPATRVVILKLSAQAAPFDMSATRLTFQVVRELTRIAAS